MKCLYKECEPWHATATKIDLGDATANTIDNAEAAAKTNLGDAVAPQLCNQNSGATTRNNADNNHATAITTTEK